MALHYDIRSCDPAATTEAGWPVTKQLIFATMPLGMGAITEKTVDEFFTRLSFFGALVGETMPTYAEVRQRIGLTTNVSPETWASFARRLTSNFRKDMLYRLRREAREAAEKGAAA